MKRLTATFDVPLGACLLLRLSESERPEFCTIIDGFEVRISFPAHHYLGGRGRGLEDSMTRAYGGVEICVTRDEWETPPDKYPEVEQEGKLVTVPYFDERAPRYRRAAVDALNRLLTYLRSRLRQPYLRLLSDGARELRNPKWTDEDGRNVGGAFIQGWSAAAAPGMHGMRLGVSGALWRTIGSHYIGN